MGDGERSSGEEQPGAHTSTHGSSPAESLALWRPTSHSHTTQGDLSLLAQTQLFSMKLTAAQLAALHPGKSLPTLDTLVLSKKGYDEVRRRERLCRHHHNL